MRGHVVLVTGGTGALGSAVARGALEAGATAVVTYRDARDLDALRGARPRGRPATVSTASRPT